MAHVFEPFFLRERETDNIDDEQPPVVFDNSGRSPLRVPGFGGIPVDYELPPDARFAHGIKEWRQTPAVTARELAMVAVMNDLTDKDEWHVEIFNDEVVEHWRAEAVAQTPLMSDKAWIWCLQELRDKAVYFTDNQHVRVLDTGCCVCKADTPRLQSLSALFRHVVGGVLEQEQEQKEKRKQHQILLQLQMKRKKKKKQRVRGAEPTGNVSSIVDPLLFPLMYGRSLVFSDGGQVDLRNVLDSYKGATTAPEHVDRRVSCQQLQDDIEKDQFPWTGVYPNDRGETEFYRWSWNYQSLPCEVEFLGDSGTDVRITSYINGLHPAHEGLYHAIEKVISLAIKPWNDCLVKGQRGWKSWLNQGQLGPVPLRIITFGVEWENELPEWALNFRVPTQYNKTEYYRARRKLARMEEGPEQQLEAQRVAKEFEHVIAEENWQLPPPDSELWQMAEAYLALPEEDGSTTPVGVPDNWTEGQSGPWLQFERKVQRLVRWKHPEPGTAFSYEEWKDGCHNNRAVVDMVHERTDWAEPALFAPYTPPHTPYKIALQETFRKQGLQVLVEMSSIELTPDVTPAYANEDLWQLPGQLNEHIVGVAVYAYDVDNITEPRVAFRQRARLDGAFYRYHDEDFTTKDVLKRNAPAHRYGKTRGAELDAIQTVLGFSGMDLLSDNYSKRSFQRMGSVATRQGRLVTFPNVVEHRIEPFQLADPGKPGHYRWLKLFLVDPHYRVCSTRNVPPQQHDWWAQVVGRDLARPGLPQEIIDQILEATGSWPMGMHEARQHRRELVKEHRWNEATKLASMAMPGF